ncbi:MAG: hypothetical protein QW790_04030 [Candidatus Aenigmatarchaeota archaeon]
MTSVLNEATTIPLEAIKSYVEHLASLRDRSEKEKKEKETSNSDLMERIQEKEEIKEKEHEKFIEETEIKEKQTEEIQEKIQEEAIKIIEQNLDEEELIKERLEAELLAVQESGLLELAETIKEYSEKEKIEELKEHVEETKEEVKERVEILDQIEDRIEKAEKDGKGIDSLSKDIEEIAKMDKGVFQREIEELSKEIKDLEKLNPEAAVRKAKEFISKHTVEREIFKEINDILRDWDELSRDEIKKRVKELHGKILNSAEAMLKAAREIENIDEKIEDLAKAILKKIEESLPEKEEKKQIIKKGEIIDALSAAWINSIITFINNQVIKAIEARKEDKERYWRNALERTARIKKTEMDSFNKELRKSLTKDDYQSAIKFAKRAVSSYLREIARILRKDIYTTKLKDVIEADKKDEMKLILKSIFERLKILDERIKILSKLAADGDIKGITDVAKTFDGEAEESIGKILLRVVRRNKTKREVIKQLSKELAAINMPLNTVKMVIEAYDKKDYEKVDELCSQIIEYVNLLNKRYSMFLELRRRKTRDGKNRKLIAQLFASDLLTFSKYMSGNLRKNYVS